MMIVAGGVADQEEEHACCLLCLMVQLLDTPFLTPTMSGVFRSLV
jgi:hypothetical protein